MLITTIPVDVEKTVTSESSIMVKADRTGSIEYANLEYARLSEYEVDELIGEKLSVLLHPDMPSTIFNHIWEKLLDKKRTFAIFKNMSKSGKYFWLQVNFDFKVNEDTREIENIYAYYSKVSLKGKQSLSVFYSKLKAIESHTGVDNAENYMKGYLEDRGIDYQDFIESFLS